jgi:hypothetical protein
MYKQLLDWYQCGEYIEIRSFIISAKMELRREPIDIFRTFNHWSNLYLTTMQALNSSHIKQLLPCTTEYIQYDECNEVRSLRRFTMYVIRKRQKQLSRTDPATISIDEWNGLFNSMELLSAMSALESPDSADEDVVVAICTVQTHLPAYACDVVISSFNRWLEWYNATSRAVNTQQIESIVRQHLHVSITRSLPVLALVHATLTHQGRQLCRFKYGTVGTFSQQCGELAKLADKVGAE